MNCRKSDVGNKSGRVYVWSMINSMTCEVRSNILEGNSQIQNVQAGGSENLKMNNDINDLETKIRAGIANNNMIVILVTNKIQYLWFIIYSNPLYMFRAIISPIIRSTYLYLQPWYNVPMLLPACNTDEVERSSTSSVFRPAATSVCYTKAVDTDKCYWGWAKLSPETCRADWNK